MPTDRPGLHGAGAPIGWARCRQGISDDGRTTRDRGRNRTDATGTRSRQHGAAVCGWPDGVSSDTADDSAVSRLDHARRGDERGRMLPYRAGRRGALAMGSCLSDRRAVRRRIARTRLAGFFARQPGEAQLLRSGRMHCRRFDSYGLLPGGAVPLLLGRRLRPVRGRLDRDAIGFRRPLAEIDHLATLRAEGPPRVVRRPWRRLSA